MGSRARTVKVYLIRHGETVDNVKSLYAGVRDSLLTVHGVNQAQRLGDWLAGNRPPLTHVFSSDLSRAAKTAEAICKAQPGQNKPQPRQLPVLQEQNFGYLEGKSWASRKDDGGLNNVNSRLEPVESKDSMAARADEFLALHLDPLVRDASTRRATDIAVVSHGMLLASLWRRMLKRQPPGSVQLASDLSTELEQVGSVGWSNTGFVELDLTGSEGVPTMVKVVAVNSRAHLNGLKRARGGIGSSAFDAQQRPIDGFFKKPRNT